MERNVNRKTSHDKEKNHIVSNSNVSVKPLFSIYYPTQVKFQSSLEGKNHLGMFAQERKSLSREGVCLLFLAHSNSEYDRGLCKDQSPTIGARGGRTWQLLSGFPLPSPSLPL